jgi:ribose transport system ATP-binding protein
MIKPTAQPILSMHGIEKRFGATQALKDISLTAHAGETLALIGENGAGKSTLMKILSGAHSPDAGTMMLDGQVFRPRGPHEARKVGIAMIYQELSLAPDLSVEENIMLGQERSHFGFIRKSQHRLRVRHVLSLLGHADLNPERKVGSLSIGTQQIVEIARGLASDAKVMVFDEPTSSLAAHDVQELFRLIRRLQTQGLAIVYISHFLEEIREIAHRYVVLRDGKSAGDGLLQDISNKQIVSLMVGRNVDELFPKVPHSMGETVLDVRELSGVRIPRSVSFKLRSGEVMGLFGLIGAGRTETLRHLMGLDGPSSGSVLIRGRQGRATPQARIRDGLGIVSEDRKGEGLSQSMSIVDNLTLSDLKPYSKLGLLNLAKRRKEADRWMKTLSIKARSPLQSVSQLSGGNQQKVAIARVLHQDATILLLDEPTRGIDVGTKAEIYQWVGELAAKGKSILFVSSYLPELMAVCDTIGVMAKGRLREVRPTNDWTQAELLSVAVSTDEDSQSK